MIAHFVLAGQSNLDEWFNANDGTALEAFKAEFLRLNPEYTDVQFFDAARGGSAMLSGSAAQYADTRAPDDPDLNERIRENYWYNETTGTAGPTLDLFTARLEAQVTAGVEFLGVIWAQGEADTTYVGEYGAEAYTEGLAYVLDQLVEASGAPEVYIQALGDRAFYSENLHGGTGDIRAAQEAVADQSDAITISTTIFDLDLRDSVHLTEAGYIEAAQRMAAAISTGERSPDVEHAVLLDADTLLVQFDLVPGQTHLGAFDMGGLVLSDDGGPVVITSATMTSGGLLRIEAAAPLSNPVLSYGAADVSVTMQASDYLYVTGATGDVPILPFDVILTDSHLSFLDIAGGVQVDGTGYSEQVFGLSGDDVLNGFAGHDTLDGGWGADTLSGGGGRDLFMLGEDGQTDVVLDFDVGQDRLGLLRSSKEGVQFQEVGADLLIETAAGERILLKDTGLAEAADILFHTMGTDAANNLQGHSGADRIFALGGDDTIDGGAGTDRITTGEGADTLMFGTGYNLNVVYDFDLSQDVVQLTDLQAASLSFKQYKGSDLEIRTDSGDRLVLRDVALADADQVVILDAPATAGVLTGTEANDVLRGTELDELFSGLSGTDRLHGGGGADVFELRDGFDLNVVYDFVDGQDRILLSAEDYATMELLTYKGSDAEVRLASGDRMVLRDVDVNLLGADDFIFDLPEAFV